MTSKLVSVCLLLCGFFLLSFAADASRTIAVNVQSGEVDIESQSKDEADKSKLHFVLVTSSTGIRVDVDAESENADVNSKKKFKLYFDKIVQYTTGGAYNRGDIVGQDYLLGTPNWEAFTCPQVDGQYTCSASTSDGVFTAQFQFAGDTFSVADLSVTPEDIKITILINNFQYDTADNNVRLALHAWGEVEVEFEEEGESEKNSKVSTGGTAFTWLNTATIDGQDVAVETSAITFENKKFDIFFSFMQDRPTSINWDPILGNSAPQQVVGCLALFVVSLWALFA